MRVALAVLFVSALGCASSRPYLGDVTLRPYSEPGAPPSTFGVERGRIVSGNLDLAMSPDGCARGEVGSAAYVLCPKPVVADPNVPTVPGESVQRWMGTGGDFVTRVSPDGKSLRVDGNLRDGHDANPSLHVTLLLGKGPQWDEIRKAPVLLTVAAAITGMSGEPDTASQLTPTAAAAP